MSREIPEAVRAAAGLAATLLDEARKLPQTLPALPVRALGLAMQTSLKLQQEYSGLVARGDEVLTGLRGDSEPGLATFDDDLPPATGPLGSRTSSFDRVAEEPVDPFDDEPGVDQVDDLVDDLAADLDVEAPVRVVDEAAAAGDDELSGETVATEEMLAEGLASGFGGADLTDAEVASLPEDPVADDITSTVDELAVTMGDDAVEDGAVIAASEHAITAALAHPHEPAAAPGDEPAQTRGDETATAPIEGYDGFSIAQLRGRLRGYQPVTVDELLAYEQATRSRSAFLTLLRNRREKLARELG